jgi:hypothetical protein
MPHFTSRRVLVTLCLSVGLAACSVGPSRTVTRTVALDSAESVAVHLKMGAGELHVDGRSSRLLDASFRLNLPSDPTVDYRRDGTRGTLTVQQQGSAARFGNTDNTWDLRLSNGVPVALNVDISAGESRLTIGSLDLQSVNINEGAGELHLDLRGTPKRSYDVKVNASVGESHIQLPKSVGIVATASAGVGNISVSGLQKQGDTWINPGHEQDPVVIHLDVRGGVGEVHVDAE